MVPNPRMLDSRAEDVRFCSFVRFKVRERNATGTQRITKTYYSAGSQLIAMRQFTSPTSSVLYFLHSDHLGSTSLTTDASGNPVARQLYDAWGNVRYVTGTLPTDITFTGQRSNLEQMGLYYFKARFYASSIGRFVSADTIVPDGKNPQAFNRYSYVNNRPLSFVDPTGHMADDGCQTQGCNLTDKDIGKMRYAELWNQYRACEQGKGGCSNPIEALVFTTIGLIGVGLLSEAPAAVGWVLDNLGIGAATTAATTASTAACADGNCTNEAQSALNLLQQLTASGGRVPVPTGQISANVMAQLQEATGLEHALIRAADGARYLLQLGGKAVDGITLAGGNLPADTVRLIAHTHPGQGLMSLIPSNFDNMVLLKLEQTFSLIINQAGEVLRWRPIPYD